MFNNFDLFSTELRFKYKGKSSIITNVGVIFSIIYVTIFVLVFIYLGKNLIIRQNPKIFNKFYNNFNRSKYGDFNNQDLIFKLKNPKFSLKEFPELKNFYNNSNDNEIYLYSNNSIRDDILLSPIINFRIMYNKTLLPLNFIKCPEDFSNMVNSEFLCFNTSISELGGGNLENDGIDLRLILTNCNGSKCINFESFKYFDKLHFMTMALANTRIQLDNYTNPIEIFDQFFNLPFIANTITYHYISYDMVIIDTDDDFIFSNNIRQKTLSFNDQTIINGYSLNITETTVIINISNVEYYYKRSYEKLQDTLASLGGITKPIMLIFGYIVKLFSNRLYYKEIANNIYIYDELNNNIKSKNLRNISNSNISNMCKSSTKIRNLIQLKSNSLNLEYTFKELIYSIVSRKCTKNLKAKEDYLEKCKHKIDNYLDIVEIIKTFAEIDRLKWVLFRDNEYKVLNFLKKSKKNIYNNRINSDYNIEFITSLENRNHFNYKNSKIYQILQDELDDYN